MDGPDDSDPGLAGLSPEFQAMLGGLSGHTKAFAQILEKRTTSSSVEKEKDDEVYLESYADLAIHEEMLKDTQRVEAYRKSIELIPEGASVIDVGAGTGLLSLMCAQRASKVLAVEASRLSHFLRRVVAQNPRPATVAVHDGLAEDLDLGSEQVDVIVSEWMGYCLLFENMLPSVLCVRDRYLKPGGMMLPSSCRLLLAPLEDEEWRKQKLDFWTSVHGIDMSSLIPLASATYCGTPQHHLVDPKKLLGDPQVIFEADLHTVQTVDLEDFESTLSVSVPAGRRLDGFVCWFHCAFGGTAELSTAPSAPATHWKQTAFYLREAVEGGGGCDVRGTVTFQKHESFTRGYRVSFDLKVPGRKPRSEAYELR